MQARNSLTDTQALKGKIIDCHTHVGVNLKAYACGEFPYAQSIEDLYYRQRLAGVDVSVVFPMSPDLHMDLGELVEGKMVPAQFPVSPIPYGIENHVLLREVAEIWPEWRDRFIPFVCADPMRSVSRQVDWLEQMNELCPIRGIKISGVHCQSAVSALLDEGQGLVEFAQSHNIPFLLHMTTDPEEIYSNIHQCLTVVESYADIRFCLAHCLGFHAGLLRRVDALPNAWVDTAALIIQVQLMREQARGMPDPADVFEADYGDPAGVLLALAETYPDLFLWGTDSPAYSFICRRKQSETAYVEFNLKSTFEKEKDCLDALSESLRMRIANTNTLRWLFGNDSVGS